MSFTEKEMKFKEVVNKEVKPDKDTFDPLDETIKEFLDEIW